MRIYLSKTGYVFASTFALVVVYNFILLISRFNVFSVNALPINYVNILGEMLMASATLIAFFTVFSFSGWLLKILTLIFIIGNSLVGYFILFNKIYFDETIVGTLFETNQAEILAFVNYKLIIWILFTLILPILILIFKIRINSASKSHSKLVGFAIAVAIQLGVAGSFYYASKIANPNLYKHARGLRALYSNYVPFNYTVAFYQYFVRLRSYTLPTKDIFNKYNFNIPQNSAFSKKDYNVVLVIGESDRADRHSLLGYKNNTNPLLATVPNLVVFKNFSSCGNISRISVNCILSHHNKQTFNYPPTEENIFSVFNNLGFNTAFLSSQSAYERGNNSFYIAAYLANKIAFSSSLRTQTNANGYIYDEYLLPLVKDILKQKPTGNFIVLYLTGSHSPYQYRYTPTFNKFNNSYDNTILYTDYVLYNLIQMFKNTPTLMFYAADHGESLGENGITGHGSTPAPIQQTHVFAFSWASNSMITKLNGKYNLIKQRKNLQLSHDNWFYSLTGCINIKHDLYENNKKLNLCY